LSPDNIRAAAEDSLRRLQTDHIDLYFARAVDLMVPQEEYLGAFDEPIESEVGASNFSGDRLRDARIAANRATMVGFTVTQDHFNLVDRAYATELMSVVAELGMVKIPYQGLASGFLTGKYRPGSSVESVRAGGAAALLDDPHNVQLLDVLDTLASARGVAVAAVALAWLRQQPTVAAPVASARTVEQLTELVSSFDLVLTPEELAALN
jgi:aryl-alcohol dehydrogenase-like predicted oxidoreductase